MILLDPRVGSAELKSGIQRHGIAVDDSENLECGDVAFRGHGPDGRCLIGIERKKVPDLLECVVDGRLSGHQLVLMTQQYKIVYVLVEGIYRPSDDGHVEELKYKGGWRKYNAMYSAMDNFLNSLQINGIHVLRSGSQQETEWMIADRYKHLQKPWDQHKAFDMFHTMRPMIQLTKPGLVASVAKEVRGVGWINAKKLGAYFNSPAELGSDIDTLTDAGLPPKLAANFHAQWNGTG